MGCGSSSSQNTKKQSGDPAALTSIESGHGGEVNGDDETGPSGTHGESKRERRVTLSSKLANDHIYDFIPLCVQQVLESDGLPSKEKPVLRRYDNACIGILDISGFSNLTRTLTEKRGGVRGAEDLSKALNQVFSTMVEILAMHGGQVLKYAGDALIVMWTDEELKATTSGAPFADGLWSVVADVIRTTHAVKALPMNLSMHSAIAVGSLTLLLCGGYENRYEYLVYGEPLIELGVALDMTVAGETILTPSAATVAIDSKRGMGIGRTTDRHCIIALDDMIVDTGPVEGVYDAWMKRHTTQGRQVDARARSFVPAGIEATLDAGMLDWLAELRDIAVLFINLPDLTYDDQTTQFHRNTQILQQEIIDHSGTVRQLLVDDKGCVLIAIFGVGAGSVSQRDLHAVQCAMAISAHGIPNAIGITTGRAFVGLIGHERRREFAAVGHLVNMSARLMGKAGKTESKVVCSALVQTTVMRDRKRPPHLCFRPLDPVIVKGSDVALEIFEPYMSETPVNTTSGGAVIGREKELHAVTQRTRALVGQLSTTGDLGGDDAPARGPSRLSSWSIVEAQAGMGKTILLNEIQVQARMMLEGSQTSISIYRIAATLHLSTRPYSVFPALLAQLFDGRSSNDGTAAGSGDVGSGAGVTTFTRDSVLSFVTDILHENALAPVLNIVLGSALDETERTRNLTGKTRQAETIGLLCAVIIGKQKELGQPALLIVDDVHWLDEASWLALSNILATIAADPQGTMLQVVIGSRPGDEYKVDPSTYQGLVKQADIHGDDQIIRLTGFTVDEIQKQMISVYGAKGTIPAVLADFVHTQTEGVPYFARELELALVDSGAVTVTKDNHVLVDEEKMTKAAESSLKDLVSSRITCLSVGTQMLVKCASVLGANFDYDLLLACLPAQMAQDLTACEQYMQEATRKALFGHNGENFHFIHVITAETAYSMLTYEQRRTLHTAAATGLLARGQDDSDSDDDAVHSGQGIATHVDAGILAYHYKNAENFVRAQEYLIRAAKNLFDANSHSQAEKMISEAIDLYETNEDCKIAMAGVPNQLAYIHWVRGESMMSQRASLEGIQQLMKFLSLSGHPFPQHQDDITRELDNVIQRVQGDRLAIPTPPSLSPQTTTAAIQNDLEINPIVVPGEPIRGTEICKCRCLAYFRVMAYCLFRSRREESYLAQLLMIEAATELGVHGYHLARAWTNAQNFALYFPSCDRSFYLDRVGQVLRLVDEVTCARCVGYLAFYDNDRGLFGDSIERMAPAVDMLFSRNLKEDAENSCFFLNTALLHRGQLATAKAYSQRMLESALGRGYTAHVEPALRFLSSAALFRSEPQPALDLNQRIISEKCQLGKWHQCHYDARQALALAMLVESASDSSLSAEGHIDEIIARLTSAHRVIADPQMPMFMAHGVLFAFDAAVKLAHVMSRNGEGDDGGGDDKTLSKGDMATEWARRAVQVLAAATDIGPAGEALACLLDLEFTHSTDPLAWHKVAVMCAGPQRATDSSSFDDRYPHAQLGLLDRIGRDCDRLGIPDPVQELRYIS